MSGVLLDTSVLIGDDAVPHGLTAAISVVSIAELHFGLLCARADVTPTWPLPRRPSSTACRC